MKRFLPVFLLVVVTIIIVIFVFFPHLLGNSLSNNSPFPLGTIISWLGLVFYTLFFYVIFCNRKDKKLFTNLKNVLLLNFLMALMWGIISYFLAGNWSFVFNNKILSFVWIALTFTIIIIPLIIFMVRFVVKILSKKVRQ